MMETLYELTGAYNDIFNLAMDDESNLDLDTLENTLQCIEASIEVKVENGIGLLRSLQAFHDNIKAEEEFHKKRRMVLENKIKSIKEYYKTGLMTLGKAKVQTVKGTMAVQNNAPSLQIDTDLLPVEYLTIVPQTYEANKEKIKADLKTGKEIPGAMLVQGNHLRIR